MKVTHEELIEFLRSPGTVIATAEHFGVSQQAIRRRLRALVSRGLVEEHQEKPLAETRTYVSVGQGGRQSVPGLRRRVLNVMRGGALYTLPTVAHAASLPETSVYPLLEALVAARWVWSFSAAGRNFYAPTRAGERARDPDAADFAMPVDFAAVCGPYRTRIFQALSKLDEANGSQIREGLSVPGRSPIDVEISKAIAGLRRDGLVETRFDIRPQRHKLTRLGVRAARHIMARPSSVAAPG